MSAEWSMSVYNRWGDLWEHLTGSEAELRRHGENITTVRGQLGWHCVLFFLGTRAAVCRRGVWREVKR